MEHLSNIKNTSPCDNSVWKKQNDKIVLKMMTENMQLDITKILCQTNGTFYIAD